ncbi:hypothetical protein V6N12_063826 [Hibiscus sabdariffa]|uniref:Uncharacterized protein n=1 Tax=Hibiscus sabdariffa TaxID=183260 RepID=A0ABR2ASG6_9ROSI
MPLLEPCCVLSFERKISLPVTKEQYTSPCSGYSDLSVKEIHAVDIKSTIYTLSSAKLGDPPLLPTAVLKPSQAHSVFLLIIPYTHQKFFLRRREIATLWIPPPPVLGDGLHLQIAPDLDLK